MKMQRLPSSHSSQLRRVRAANEHGERLLVLTALPRDQYCSRQSTIQVNGTYAHDHSHQSCDTLYKQFELDRTDCRSAWGNCHNATTTGLCR
jgi:hypothetical protein